jgi:hypothetical protein
LFPPRRPAGLRLRPIPWTLWRIDGQHPDLWTWDPFASPRNRFDPPSGRFRVRYAANLPVVAARERFVDRHITHSHADLWLVRLDGFPSGLHLTHQANLDALGLDDRVSTGRIDVDRDVDPDPLLDTSGELADAVFDWWDGAPPPLVYRSRAAPDHRNVAFTSNVDCRVGLARPLREAVALHAHLVMHAGFTVPEAWLR